MFNFLNKMPMCLSDDQIAKLLQTTPEALEQFEKAYAKASEEFNQVSDNLMDYSVKDGKQNRNEFYLENDIPAVSENIVHDIVADLLETDVTKNPRIGTNAVSKLPKKQRPQLTANAYTVDCDTRASSMVLFMYANMLKAKNEKERRMYYHQFRQGLDILDLDPLLYTMIGQNINSMGYWFPKLKEAVDSQTFFKIPKTQIIKVPLPILQMSRLQYETLTPTTIQIINEYCMKVFNLDIHKTYFVKTGTYSSKFNFRNAKVTGEKEVRELGEYLLFLSHQAVEMASPLTQPSIYGVSTTNEWVVREYIEDVENNPCIYNGMPLHTEYRVFADFDTDEILGINPYWKPDVMLKRFSSDANPYSPHDKHDYIIYKMHEPTLMKRYEENKDTVLHHIEQLIKDIDLSGQWSIDIMQNGNDFWIIDMATADTSALNDCVPKDKLKKATENWLPML